MRVLNLECKNFRNLENINVQPDSKMNVICGENAQGKTNLIEAIWLFTGAKSFRSKNDNLFLKFGCEKACCNLSFLSEGIENNAKIEITEKRTAYLNENKLKSPSLLAGKFNAIIFSPIDLGLVSNGPNIRRKFLDTAIGQLYPSYIEILRNYLRAVTQRNKLIKDYKYDSTLSVMLEVFEKEIAENGQKIIEFRKKYINILNQFIPSLYDGISKGKESLECNYQLNSNGDLLEKLEFSRKEDMFTGTTSVGPHRDEIDFKINGISARNFGSQGQKRSVALAVKLSEAEVIKNKTGEYPVILLDDVMSELDKNRQNFILNHIEGMQSFLSCCDENSIKNLNEGKKFKVRNGRII